MLSYKKKVAFQKLWIGLLLVSTLGYTACARWFEKPLTDKEVVDYSKEGIMLARKGKLDEARKMLELVLRNDSEKPEVKFVLGGIYVKQNKNEEAVKLLEEVRSLNSKKPDFFHIIGKAYFQAGNQKQAQEEYKTALSLNSRHAVTHNARGELFKAQGKKKKAEKAYRRSLKIDPNLGAAHYNMGLLFEERKRYQKALSEYKAAVNFGEKSDDVYYHLGSMLNKIYSRRKTINITDYETAADALEHVLARDIKNAEELEQAKERKHREIHYLLGIAYLKNYSINKKSPAKEKFLPKAIEQFEKALEQGPLRSDYHHGLGTAYEAKGMIDEAIKGYNKAIELDGKNIGVRVRLADVFFRQKKYDRAEELSQEILKIDPKNPQAKQRLAQIKKLGLKSE